MIKIHLKMRNKIKISLTIISIIFLGTLTNAQHNINIKVENSATKLFCLGKQSEMHHGKIEVDKEKSYKLEDGEDGKIVLRINGFSNVAQEVKLGFQTYISGGDYFQFKLFNGDLTIDESYDGAIETNIMVGSSTTYQFKQTDILEVFRCGNAIVYKLNGTTIRNTPLNDNDFQMEAFIDFVETGNSPFYGNIKFIRN